MSISQCSGMFIVCMINILTRFSLLLEKECHWKIKENMEKFQKAIKKGAGIFICNTIESDTSRNWSGITALGGYLMLAKKFQAEETTNTIRRNKNFVLGNKISER